MRYNPAEVKAIGWLRDRFDQLIAEMMADPCLMDGEKAQKVSHQSDSGSATTTVCTPYLSCTA